MPFTFGDVRRSLKKKGFTEEAGGRDHVYLRLYYNGKKTNIYTKCSHGKDKDDVGNPLVSAMREQLELDTRKDVADLVQCPMSADRYLEILKEKGSIPA